MLGTESQDGLSLYIASNRSGGHGKLDVWRSRRITAASSWGQLENVGSTVNSTEYDYCRTPLQASGCGSPCRPAQQHDLAVVDTAAHHQHHPQCSGLRNPRLAVGRRLRLHFGRKLTLEDPGDVFVSTRPKR